MKEKLFNKLLAILLIFTLTIANFLTIGVNIASYAANDNATNHQNVEFSAYFDDNSSNKQTTELNGTINEEEITLHLNVSVKKEGYFNGKVTLEDSNFNFVESSNEYVSEVKDNTITLNQINAGATADIKIKVKPIREERYKIGLLNSDSKLNITGVYRDSKEKDIKINATKTVKLNIIENNKEENVLNNISIITNKIAKIDGEDKRVVQISWDMGLKDNNYPIEKINAKLPIPTIDGNQAEVKKVVYVNNMTSWEYNYKDSIVNISLENKVSEKTGNVSWKTEGNERVVLTCIYEKDVNLENLKLQAEEEITLYNSKKITVENTIDLNNQEQDNIIEVTSKSAEESIYKGKLNAGIERKYSTTTDVKINYSKIPEYISINEGTPVLENESNTKESSGKVRYQTNTYIETTILKKEQVNKLFGEDGILTIYNQDKKVIATINKDTAVDENNNIIINYENDKPEKIEIITTKPISEGDMEINNIRNIQSVEKKGLEECQVLLTEVEAKYYIGSEGIEKKAFNKIKLNDSETEATLNLNKETLSTVVTNNVEMKVTLKSNDEKYELYKNPTFKIELPSQVEAVKVNSIDIMYDNELKVANCQVAGNIINIKLEGEQTQYKDQAIEGTNIIINADITVNKKSATKEEEIKMTYYNENGVKNNKSTSQKIKIVAPKDITTINSIKDLHVETIGQEESKEVIVERGKAEKQIDAQIEIINNNESAIENVKILGDFPTNRKSSNMNIEILKGITLQGTQNAKIYYSENEEATDDLDNKQNKWQEEIQTIKNAKKYLIVVDKIDSQSSVEGTYTMKIPANLEYNQEASTYYEVEYTNVSTKIQNKLSSTRIKLQTGIGPKAETKITSTVAGEPVNGKIRNGEVIKYKIQISNVGTEDIKDLRVTAQVPEGTKMVIPEKNYEYTGASYYEELDLKQYEETISTLKVGEVVYKEYEVRVNSETKEGTKLVNTAEIRYGDVIKQSDKIENETSTGNLRVTVKRVTDRKTEIYESSAIKYFAIIENISDKKQENIKVKSNIQGNLSVEELYLITGMKKETISDDDILDFNNPRSFSEENVKEKEEAKINSELVEYKDEINIGSLEAGEAKVLSYNMLVNKIEDNKNTIDFSVIVKNGKDEYKSNDLKEEVKSFSIKLSMEDNTESQYVKSGDIIEYTITAKNESNASTKGLIIKDSIPSQLTINKITVDGEEIELSKGNDVQIPCTIAANSTTTIKIQTVVNYSANRNKVEAITNTAYAEVLGEKIATTSERTHFIKADETTDPSNPTGGEDDDNKNNEIQNPDIAEGSKTITGLAWYDENANGKKDENEKAISNVKVKLLNTTTNNFVKDKNGNVLEVTTNENGIYILDNIGNGKYIVIFDYDKAQYGLTKYKVGGVSDKYNSDAALNTLKIGNEELQVASTDILEVNNNDISGINIGFIKLQNFDLKLDKFVNRILLQDSNGTTVKEYNNTTMAKVELDAKKVKGTTVIVEYNIAVTNNGEVEGYAKKIVDYMPNNLKFSSELNKEWYQSGDVLYSTSLANDKLKPGETKILKLTLTKSMTGEDTGLINNRAEIAEDYNELGIADSNSIPGNNKKNENDMGTAEVILSIRTGGIIYITIAIITIVILAIVVVIVIKMKKTKESNNKNQKESNK